jgi:hypothetical protein
MKGGVKLILLGLLLYLAFKMGKNKKDNVELVDGKPKMSEEEKYIRELIDELSSKKNKTSRDKDNVDLLMVKLKQILSS